MHTPPSVWSRHTKVAFHRRAMLIGAAGPNNFWRKLLPRPLDTLWTIDAPLFVPLLPSSKTTTEEYPTVRCTLSRGCSQSFVARNGVSISMCTPFLQTAPFLKAGTPCPLNCGFPFLLQVSLFFQGQRIISGLRCLQHLRGPKGLARRGVSSQVRGNEGQKGR